MPNRTPNSIVRRRSIIAAMTVALSLVPVAAGATPAKAQALPTDLPRALDAYNVATTHNDTATLAKLMTDDYLLVNSDGSMQGKGSYLADFAVPGFKVDPYEMEAPIHRVRGATALTGWTMRLGWSQNGGHQNRQLRIAHFWVRQHGHWQIAYTQLTRVPE